MSKSFSNATLVVVVIGATSPAVATPAPPDDQCPVRIEIEDRTALTIVQRQILRDELRGIWARYVELVWGGQSVLAENTLALRVVVGDEAAPRQATRLQPGPGLGWIRFLDASLPTNEIHADAAETKRLLQRAHFRGQPVPLLPRSLIEGLTAQALARVIAHELGHVLLSSPDHATTGLMRPAFSPDAIVGSLQYFSLTADEEAQLRRTGHCRSVQRVK